METHIVFVATFAPDKIEVSDGLPKARPMSGFEHNPFPVYQGHSLKRLRVESETYPVLPDGDLTQEQYFEWRSILPEDAIREETVDPKLIMLGMAGLCVDVGLTAILAAPYGTLLEAAVTNVGPYPIGKVQVVWNGQWEPSVDGGIIGKGFHFLPVGECRTGQNNRIGIPARYPHGQTKRPAPKDWLMR